MEALANIYRPDDWKDVTEQSSIVKIFSRQIELGQVKNAYLLCGPTGVGKTTLARLLAKKINHNIGEPLEIDAASNNSVENIRMIIKSAQERSLDGTYKIFIIDECHMLSNQAWNAALKLLEEPPEYSIFIFCTTDPQKIPATILNRVQRFNLNKISTKGIYNRLNYICNDLKLSNYEPAIEYISKIANGGMRDAISMLDKCLSLSSDLNINNVLNALGNYSYELMFKLVNGMIDGDDKLILSIIESLDNNGNDLKLFVDQFLKFVLDLNKYIIFNSYDIISIPNSFENDIKNAINIEDNKKYFKYLVDKLFDLKNLIKTEINPKISIEIFFIQISRCE